MHTFLVSILPYTLQMKMSPDLNRHTKRPRRLPPLTDSKVVAPLVAPIPVLAPRAPLPPLPLLSSEIIQDSLPPITRVPVRLLLAPEPAPTTPLPRSVPLSSPPPAPTKSIPKYNFYDMETCNCKCNNPIHTRSNIMLAKATMRGILWGDILDDWTYDI